MQLYLVVAHRDSTAGQIARLCREEDEWLLRHIVVCESESIRVRSRRLCRKVGSPDLL